MSGGYDEPPPELDYEEEDLEEDLDEETVGSTILELLEKYKQFLSAAINSGEISQEEFDVQMLNTTYELDTRSKTYVLSVVDKEQMDQYIFFKEELIKDYENGNIDIDTFNSKYAIILRKELVILRRSEDKKGTKIKKSKVPEPIKKTLEKLQDSENAMIKKIAKERNIKFPILPTGYSKEDIDRYYKYRARITDTLRNPPSGDSFNELLEQLRGVDIVQQRAILDSITDVYKKEELEKELTLKPILEIDEVLDEYIKKITEFKKLIDYHMDSFVISKKIINDVNGRVDYEFEYVESISHKIDELKKSALEKVDNLSYSEKFITNRLKTLKNLMRKMGKENLIKCIVEKMGENFPLIDKLKDSKIKSLKFKDFEFEVEGGLSNTKLDVYEYRLKSEFLRQSDEGVENLAEIEKILEKEEELARETQGFNQKLEELIREDLEIYGVTYEDIYEPFSYSFYDFNEDNYYEVEEEIIPYYALDEQDFSLILPISKDTELQSETAKNTEVVDTWILKKPGGVTKRYLSFKKYLFQFKEQLIQELKEIEIKLEQIKTSEKTKEKIRKEQEERDKLIASGEASDMQLEKDEPMMEEVPINVNKRAVAGIEKFKPEKWREFLEVRDPSSNKRKLSSEEGEESDFFRIKRETNESLKQRVEFLKETIKKINFYLEFELSIEKSYQTAQLSPGEMSQDEIDKLKLEGCVLLHNYISDPGKDEFVKNIWDSIFNFSSLNYKKNMEKIKFIFINFPDKLDELIAGEININELLTFETPLETPPIDLLAGTWNEEADRPFLEDDKLENISRLLQWRPDTSIYDTYKAELDNSAHDFKRLKENHPELTHLEIREIMSQYAEKNQWESTLSRYEELEVPKGRARIKWPEREVDYDIDTNFRLRWLMKRRNQLPSRRQYILASIETRVEKLKEITNNLKRCGFENSNELASIIETTIFTLSKTPEDYMYYNFIVNKNFIKFCAILKEKESLSTLESFRELIGLDNIKELIILIVTYVSSSCETFQTEKIRESIVPTNKDELEAYIKGLMVLSDIGNGSPAIDDEVEQATIALNAIQLEDSEYIEDLQVVVRKNTYIPPTITQVPPSIPVSIREEGWKKYIRVGDNYIYGGYFPPFYYDGGPNIMAENYTRENLVYLATIFGINIIRDGIELSNLELYNSIMSFIDTYESTQYKKLIVRPLYYHVETEEYLKIPVKNIKYTYRPRLNVPPPGQVYPVYEDKYFKYGVPIKYNDDTIPIYPKELIRFFRDKFIKIEGPFIFSEKEETSFFDVETYMSNFYILVKYKDFRGDKTFCREGVAVKKVMKRIPTDFFGCDRYKNEEDCNNPFSFSMETDIYDINKQKRTIVYKCGWDSRKGICSGIIPSDEGFDIPSVYFGDTRDEIWRRELGVYRKNLETSIKEKGIVDIKEAEEEASEQKKNLFLKYKELLNSTVVSSATPMEEIPPTELPGESDTYSKTEESELKEFISSLLGVTTPLPARIAPPLVKGYKEITLYTYVTEIVPNGNMVKIKSIPRFCLVANEDYDYPSRKDKLYYWIQKSVEYRVDTAPGMTGDTLLKTYTTKLITGFPPPNSIKLNPGGEIVNGKRVITLAEIKEAMIETAFKTFETSVSDEVMEFTDVGILVPVVKVIPGWKETELRKEKNKEETKAKLQAEWDKYSEEVRYYKGVEAVEKSISDAIKLVAVSEKIIPRVLIIVQPDAIKFAIEHKIDIISLFTEQKFRDKLLIRTPLSSSGETLPPVGLLNGVGFILSGQDKDLKQILIDRPKTKIISITDLQESIQKALDNRDIKFLYENFSLGLTHLKDDIGEELMKNVAVILKENEEIRKEQKEEKAKTVETRPRTVKKLTSGKKYTAFLPPPGKDL